MNDWKDTARKQNKGFSLITVIIAVAFIGILGLLVLYMALSNFQMKITDLKGKDSFHPRIRPQANISLMSPPPIAPPPLTR